MVVVTNVNHEDKYRNVEVKMESHVALHNICNVALVIIYKLGYRIISQCMIHNFSINLKYNFNLIVAKTTNYVGYVRVRTCLRYNNNNP
ncbi:hypothetical protein V1477_008639 [Vespula maculifrons]|uniref:Uncharacterized protein n=1 Tax=Vespula maculifrons TaxID=7453 RepID=A0ABD2CDM7_VESMC